MSPLRLYVREGCHLCEEMLAQLQPILRDREFPLELVDVDRTRDKLHEYGTRIPVLETREGRVLCEAFLDQAKLTRYLDQG
jgi:hypothetical protein